ncbi:MAG: dUTP diphosphatase [Rickettsiales bacterium]|jgi:dUTP pyrophosphatase|nr:dUTP diphosphatase [Rickettsiales bacterium]
MNKIRAKILYLPNYDLAAWGEMGYAHDTDSGFDLRSCDDFTLAPMQRAAARCGFKLQLERGYGYTIRPRSGNAIKLGLSMPNAIGTIDNGFLGEVCVLLVNMGEAPIHIEKGMRIAQAVVEPIHQIDFTSCASEADFEATSRAEGGFGSSGVS